MCPILAALVSEGKFPFSSLAAEPQATSEYWIHWWNTHPYTSLARPEIIANEDSILQATIDKETVDTQSNPELLAGDLLWKLIANTELPLGLNLDRVSYRNSLVELLYKRAVVSSKPVAVFAGGGYGSGKTNTLNFMHFHNQLPILGEVEPLGVDSFKPLIPE